MTEKFDLVVIGGGSGGLAAAQRAADTARGWCWWSPAASGAPA